ncbi:MAG: PH domain-containing protein [Propionibacteriaceae bacterium]|jgi:hypothetical protein|nr:PH domain-containing protein [Propionibacteriaceae bacterium]
MSRPSLLDPQVDRYLLADQGEYIIDEVHKHTVALISPTLEALASIPVILLAPFTGPLWPVFFAAAAALFLHGAYRFHSKMMDRFVITNMRVFRVHGVFLREVATMPLARILDITVHQPWLGMIFNYGHFTFESAAQTQGLREITFVGDPTKRDLTIQRVIQQAGLRAEAKPTAVSEDTLVELPVEPRHAIEDPDGT